jgi:translocation and assembly module TamB
MKWPKFRRPRLLITGALLLPALLGTAVLGLFWTLKQDSGTAWLLARVPGLQIEAPKGALLGDFSARQLVYTLPADGGRITLNGVVWRSSSLAWSSAPQLWGELKLAYLHVDRVDIALKPSTETAKAPTSLTLPLGVDVAQLEIDQINLPELGDQPLRLLKGSLVLSADRGTAHQLQLDALSWDRWQISGAAKVQTAGSMTVAARLALAPNPAEQQRPQDALADWRASVELAGPLQALQAKAVVSSVGQHLNATAKLQPFAPWPLAAFEADAHQLDLSALVSSLPRTALSGTAVLASSGWSEPARLAIQLSNTAAGRWDQGLLPVQRLHVELQGRPDQPRSLQLRGLDLLLGGPAAPGGRLTGDGQLAADESWRLNTQVSGLRASALDARLAPLRLNGSIAVTDTPKLPLQLTAKLSGDLLLPGQSAARVRLSLQAQQDGSLVKINEALLSAGRSQLQLSGEASGNTSQWRAQLDATLKDFDPRLLWLGSAGAAAKAWQRSPSSLNATLKAQLQHASSPASKGFVWPLGDATLTVQPSQWVGMGLNGRLVYGHAVGKDAALQAQLNVGDNQLQAQATVQGQTKIDTMVDLKAPRLDAFAPLLALIAPGTQLRGAADGRLHALVQQGSSAALQVSSDGGLNLQNLQLTPPTPALPTRLSQAKLRWQADSRLDAPLALNAALQGLAIGKQSASAINLNLQGSWAQHRLTAALQGKTSTELNGSAKLALTGQLSSSPLQAWQDLSTLNWRARVTQLLARPSNPQLPDWVKVAEASPLELQLQARANPAQAGLITASVAPGRIELGGAQLRWTELQWAAPRNASEHASVRAEIELEPLPVAPLLARWQPDFGWGGKLVVGGRASVRTVPELSIDMELLRQEGTQSGDLSVTDERGVQPLGLTDLRLTLNAHDGIWQFTQALAGTTLGTFGGSVTVNAARQALWPAPTDKLSGVLRANINNLGTWGGWVPAGWRLGGNVEASLQLGGTVGGPELTGQANGNAIAVRNPLLGVDVTEGSFALNLKGDNATLTSLSAKGGAGTVTASGQATLGEQPTAKLQVKAERFVLLNRVDRRLQVSGNADLDLGADALQLIGKINVDEGLFDFSRGDAPSLDDDVTVLRPETVPEPAALLDANGKPLAKPPSAAARKTVIQLAIGLGDDLKLRGRGFDSRLRGDLKLAQTDGKLTLNGVVTTYGGTYEAYGQKLAIERGEITFLGPYDNPRLSVLAVRASNDDVRVGVSVLGSAMSPRIKLFSEPEMSDTDKLSWLVLGRAPDGLGRADTALLQRAALALLSGEGESSSGKLIKNLGLDELSVQQNENDTRGTVVRLGKQLSRRWFVGYERGLNATTGSWQLIYRIAQRFTLRAQSGDDNALELIWQWKWE